MSNKYINTISTNNNLSNTKIQNENNKHETFQSQSTSSNNSIEEENINDEIINILLQLNVQDLLKILNIIVKNFIFILLFLF